jgi:hypothetical protein
MVMIKKGGLGKYTNTEVLINLVDMIRSILVRSLRAAKPPTSGDQDRGEFSRLRSRR